MTWQTLLKDYLFYLKIEKGLQQNSINSYKRDVYKLIYYLDEYDNNISATAITYENLQDFIYHSSKNVASSTQARLISALKSFFNYLVFENYRETNPAELLETPKIGLKLPDTLSEEEIKNIISAIELTESQGKRNKAMLETLYGCGLRVSELVNLRLSDLFLNEDFIRVLGKGNKQRYVPINATAKKNIIKYIRCRDKINVKKGFEDSLFLNRNGKSLTRHMVYHIVKSKAKEAGINKKISPHTFRHSFATHLLKNGADLRAIQQMLGHESITTTEIYMHLDKTFLQKVVAKYHPREKRSEKG